MVPDSAQALFSVPASLILGAPEALPFVRERNLKHPGTAEGLEPSPSGPPSFRPVTAENKNNPLESFDSSGFLPVGGEIEACLRSAADYCPFFNFVFAN